MKLSADELRTINEMFVNGETARLPVVLSATDQVMQDMMNAQQAVVDAQVQADAQNQFNRAQQQMVDQAHAHEHVAHEHEHVAHENVGHENVGRENAHQHDLVGMEHADHTPARPNLGRVSPVALSRASLDDIIAALSKPPR
jgi:hypothetical protein